MRTSGSTIRDVALRAGVSVGTASKAFNRKGSLADETRRRVLQAAADLHFTPNALIRSLQRGRTHAIGVFTWEVRAVPSQDITMHLLKGITDGIAAARFDTLLYSHFPERDAEGQDVEQDQAVRAAMFLDGRVDGLILATGVDAAALAALATAGLPTVVLYCPRVPDTLGYVDVDNVAGVRAAVDHLIALGHRRIAFYAPYFTFNYSDRAEGYRQALRSHGLCPDPDLCLIGESGIPSVEAAVDAACDLLLRRVERPTALVAGDDSLAFHWLGALGRRGVRVPEDMSVVGFDDASDSVLPPGLTTIRQPAREVGQTAARFVAALIDGCPAVECRAVLPVELVVRGTTAPPRPVL